MISTLENHVGPSLAGLETLTREYADRHRQVGRLADEMQGELDRLKARHLAGLREAVRLSRAARAQLDAGIQAHPELFDRPRTVIMHGVKIGLAKGKGRLTIADERATILKIKQMFGPNAADFLHLTVSPNKTALGELSAGALKKLGVTVAATGDVVVIKPAAGGLEQFLSLLLPELPEG